MHVGRNGGLGNHAIGCHAVRRRVEPVTWKMTLNIHEYLQSKSALLSISSHRPKKVIVINNISHSPMQDRRGQTLFTSVQAQ